MASRWDYIRQAAAQARTRLARASNRSQAEVDARVDVHAMAEMVYQLSTDLDVLPPGIHAILDPDGELIRIYADAGPEEERLLIAHELGHAELEGLTHMVVDHAQHISSDVAGLFETNQ
ncbi:MAG TPA: hypothetical protein VEF04_11585, partial [Blastocatellia bacterium]|nr:hypothetical protein [Blastocatellia bacterium]